MKKLSIAICLLTCVSTPAFSAETSSDYADGIALFSWAEYRFPSLFPSTLTETQTIDDYVVRYYFDTSNYIGVRAGAVYGFGPAFTSFENIGNDVRYIGLMSDLSNDMLSNGFKSTSGPALVVSEAVAKDSNGGPDWFELYAAGTEAVSLSQYQVKDGNDERELFTLPNVTLAAGQYLKITASDDELYSTDLYNAPFNLGSNDRVQLYKDGVLIDDLDWDSGEAPVDYSFGRYPGPFSNGMLLTPTPGAANQLASAEAVAVSSLGAVGSLMSDIVHELTFNFDPSEYESMVQTYTSTGEKVWLAATITIDEEVYENVGIRLKGNSSLRDISPNDAPNSVPWLVKFDKFVDGQDHDGLEEFVIRSNNSSTSLNEAVALEMLDLAGLASQDAIATAFSVNGSSARLRLAIEHPDDEWMEENFSSSGALYKAESTGDYSYRGDDPASYDEVFDQEAGKDNVDMSPLIAFLKFINEADDSAFAQQLPSMLDTESFASYLAMQDLLNNLDGIDGPGNNSYLYYDTITGQFTVVPWDYNLAFGPLQGGAGDVGGGAIGGGGPGGGFPPQGNPPGQAPGQQAPDLPQAGGQAPGIGGNILAERFLANEQWNALYSEKLASLRETFYTDGVAHEILAVWQSIINSSQLVDENIIESEAQTISAYFN